MGTVLFFMCHLYKGPGQMSAQGYQLSQDKFGDVIPDAS